MFSHFEVESVSWNDLELMKPLDTMIFRDAESVNLISEFAEENKDWIKCVCAKVGLYDFCFYFKEIKTSTKPWHKPQKLSADFLENQLFRMRGSDIVTAEQLKYKLLDSFAATKPARMIPTFSKASD